MTPLRKTLEFLSKKGKRDYVRIVREPVQGESKIRVLWKENGRRMVETYEDTRNGLREARAFADGKHEYLKVPPAVTFAPITLRDLFVNHVAAMETEWEENTLRLAKWRWGMFELYAGRDTLATAVRSETLDGFKKALLHAHAPNQVRLAIKTVTGIFRWAVERDLIPPTKVTNYKAGLKALLRTGPKMAEYTRDERERIIAAFDPRQPAHWRAWALNVVFAYCGSRQDATRHLEIDDIELTATGGRIRWRAETNKTDTEWWQPMPAPVVDAFWVALGWRQHDEYTGRFVFYGVQRRTRGQALRRNSRRARGREALDGIVITEKPYTYAAFNSQLHEAEKRAGVARIKYRAAHGHRRGVAGDVHAATGSEKSAADWIGDRSTRVVRDHYLLSRQEELAKTASLMETRSGPEGPGAKRNEMQRPTTEGGPEPSRASESTFDEEPAVGIEPTTARSRDDGKWPIG